MPYRSEALAIVDDRPAFEEASNCRTCKYLWYGEKPVACTNPVVVREMTSKWDEPGRLVNMQWFNRLRPAALRAWNGLCEQYEPSWWERVLRFVGRSRPRRLDPKVRNWIDRLIRAGEQDRRESPPSGWLEGPGCKNVYAVTSEAGREHDVPLTY